MTAEIDLFLKRQIDTILFNICLSSVLFGPKFCNLFLTHIRRTDFPHMLHTNLLSIISHYRSIFMTAPHQRHAQSANLYLFMKLWCDVFLHDFFNNMVKSKIINFLSIFSLQNNFKWIITVTSCVYFREKSWFLTNDRSKFFEWQLWTEELKDRLIVEVV